MKQILTAGKTIILDRHLHSGIVYSVGQVCEDTVLSLQRIFSRLDFFGSDGRLVYIPREGSTASGLGNFLGHITGSGANSLGYGFHRFEELTFRQRVAEAYLQSRTNSREVK